MENINYLVTFGKKGKASWGDDDYNQTFFFVVPESYKRDIFIRIFDPDVGGRIDEQNGSFDTQTRFSVYGGRGCYTHPDARKVNPVGAYNSGSLLDSRTFSAEAEYDGKWYTFGPFNIYEGERVPELGGYIFKLIADGQGGDDGNLYYYYLSESSRENKAIEGANAFTFEYTLRIENGQDAVLHIFPYIPNGVTAITQYNFDFDRGGSMVLYSSAKYYNRVKMSGDNQWASSRHPITEAERNGSIDIQIVSSGVRNNNMVFYITNEYENPIAVFNIPIGGAPRYKYNAKVLYKERR